MHFDVSWTIKDSSWIAGLFLEIGLYQKINWHVWTMSFSQIDYGVIASDEYDLIPVPTYNMSSIPEPLHDKSGKTTNSKEIHDIKTKNRWNRAEFVASVMTAYLKGIDPAFKFLIPREDDTPDTYIGRYSSIAVDKDDLNFLSAIKERAIAYESLTEEFTLLGLSAADYSKSMPGFQMEKERNRAIAKLQSSAEYPLLSASEKFAALDKIEKDFPMTDDEVVKILTLTVNDLPKRVRLKIRSLRDQDKRAALRRSKEELDNLKQRAVNKLKKCRIEGTSFSIDSFRSSK